MSQKTVRITHIDGKLPNLALMRLSAWHKTQGDIVVFSKRIMRDMFEPVHYDRVYASSIFTLSANQQRRFLDQFPNAIVGGTGFAGNGHEAVATLGAVGVPDDFNGLDYSLYPDFTASIGFSQRGCRLKCKFCVVPAKEGKNHSVARIADIWRGAGHPRHVHLLDNDFFGSDYWPARCDELLDGGFKVCFSQGINIRLFDQEQAAMLAKLDYRDTKFDRKRIYTAWDNQKDENRFFSGIGMLETAGINPAHIMAYMLIGYRHDETEADIFYRIDRMKARGILPYPMVYTAPGHIPNRRLKMIQRWVVRGLYRYVEFEDYKSGASA